jgi:hypothetical protein
MFLQSVILFFDGVGYGVDRVKQQTVMDIVSAFSFL